MNELKYSNPVWQGYCADPFVLKHEGHYYCYGTSSGSKVPGMNGRKFVLLRSPNLVDWEFVGGALNPAPETQHAAHWAPEVAYAHGKFWMYYSAAIGEDSEHHLRVAVADSPEGPFEDTGEILPTEEFCIDASPFQDPQSGKWYLYYAKDFFEDRVGTGTAVVELADDMKTAITESQVVVVATHDWQIYERDRTNYGKQWEAWHTVEGPFVVFKDGKYYCFFSGGNWQNESYGVGYAVADNPLGPWTSPVIGASVLHGTPNVIGPGHNSVVLSPDEITHICVYHAWNEERTERQLCIDPIEWTSDGPRVIPTSSRE